MNWGEKDSDVDVIASTNGWPNMVIDCKYRSDNEGKIGKELSEWAKTVPDNQIPMLLIHSSNRLFKAVRLKDLTPKIMAPAIFTPGLGIAPPIDDKVDTPKFWVTSITLRKDAKYLIEWFDKLKNTYIPLKTAEFEVEPATMRCAVCLRAKGLEPIIIWE